MPDKDGINTDEADEESYEAAEEYTAQRIAEEWSSTELRKRYENLKMVTLKNLPNLWPGLEFALSVKSILNIKGCTLPFIGILLGPASSLKTVIVELFRGYKHTSYTDNFSPRSLVSHSSGLTEKQLRKVDLLPRIKNKYFLTPELAPIFAARDDDLLQVLGILTRVADGQGYESDSGVQGHRGYRGDLMFVWLGACVDIPFKVHKLLGTLGPKLYFFRLPRIEEDEDYYFNTRNEDFKIKRQAIRTALLDYLVYFEMNPEATTEEKEYGILQGVEEEEDDVEDDGVPKVTMKPEMDDEHADRIIIRLSKLLAHLRAVVPTWETKGTQGSEYAYALPKIEDPTRAITQLRNLARGHALSQGRTYITIHDIPIVILTVLSTASTERVTIFDLLLGNGGVLTTSQICDFLDTSKPTALRTMTELKVAGLVDVSSKQELDDQNNTAAMEMRLKEKFEWFLSDEFKQLRESNTVQRCKEKCPPHTRDFGHTEILQEYDSISGENNDEKPQDLQKRALGGGEISLHGIQSVPEPEPDQTTSKPLEEWTSSDFINIGCQTIGCIYCLNNRGYQGPLPLSEDDYLTHIVKKHPNKPPFPGPADIEKYGLKLSDNGGNGKEKGKSQVANAAAADNQSSKGVFGNNTAYWSQTAWQK